MAPAIRVVSGWPTDDELAALVAVLTAAASGNEPAPPPVGSRWSSPSGRLRSAYGPSRGGWRASGLPS
ncbi:acyl-CoA carboxylase epsilon subunit [Dermatophilaceae bacterium Soc4.6]